MTDSPSDNVVILPVITRLDLPPSRVIENLPPLSSVIVIGRTMDGDEFFASSLADGGDVLWLIERTKLKLLRVSEDQA